jgi:hypothetical protein
MGECGCNNCDPQEILRIGDYTIAVEIYPGCEYCTTSPGVYLHIYTNENAREYCAIEDREVINLTPDDDDHKMRGYPLILPVNLAKAARELKADDMINHYDLLTDWLSDYALPLLQISIAITQRDLTTEGK